MPQPQGRPPGVYLNLPMEEYHKDPAVGGTDLKAIMVSDADFWQSSPLNTAREELDTAAFKFGRAYHLMVLEPEKPFPFKIKEDVQTSKVPGMFGRGDYNDLLAMLKRLMRQPAHWNALHGGFAEVSIFYQDEETGLMCKIRPDNFKPEWVGDLKSDKDISDHGLYYSFPKNMYPLSGYRYSRGMMTLKKMIGAGYKMPPEFDKAFIDAFMAEEKQAFAFVLQDKKAPHNTRLWNMTPWVSEIGASYYIPGLAKIKAFYDNPKYMGLTEPPIAYPDVENITEGMIYDSKKF